MNEDLLRFIEDRCDAIAAQHGIISCHKINEVLYRIWKVRTVLEMASAEAQKKGLPALMANFPVSREEKEIIRILENELRRIRLG